MKIFVVLLTGISFCALAIASILQPTRSSNRYVEEAGACQQGTEICAAALIPHIYQARHVATLSLKVLDLVEESTFEAMKQGLQAGASFPIGPIKITPTMTWSDFRTRRSEVFKSHRYEEDSTRTFEELRTFIPPDAYRAFEACIDKTTGPSFGWTIWPAAVTDDQVIINVRWISPPNAAQTSAKAVLRTNAKATTLIASEIDFSTSQTRSFYFERPVGPDGRVADMTVTVEGGKMTETYKLPKLVILPARKEFTLTPEVILTGYDVANPFTVWSSLDGQNEVEVPKEHGPYHTWTTIPGCRQKSTLKEHESVSMTVRFKAHGTSGAPMTVGSFNLRFKDIVNGDWTREDERTFKDDAGRTWTLKVRVSISGVSPIL